MVHNLENFEKFRFYSNYHLDFNQIFEKISILVKFSKNFDCFENFEKFRFRPKFWDNNSQKFRFWLNFWIFSIEVKFTKKISIFGKKISLNFDFSQIFEKISILVKIFKNFEKFRFYSHYRKISILVKFSKKVRFWSNFRKISISVQIFEKFRFCRKFSEIFDFDFGQNFEIISILVTIFKNCEKFRFNSNFRKINLVKLTKEFDFGRSKFSKNLDFGKIFEKKIAFAKLFEKNIRFCWKFSKISKKSNFTEIFEKFQIKSNFRKFSIFLGKLRTISISFKFSKNFEFGQNFE